ncbi:group II intron maturase-specific domain-containing protein [Eubacterium sp. An11]|uniref:group II intron maturase-specific domain-containing protein n=1 Tax=Eubacterium sp. An11 TaxID=1965542 RepID=UPI001FA85C8D|nr:group II intron maturase-specific domain-containing protein [Eubacterium sp. An11]
MRNNFIASVGKTAVKGFRDKIKALGTHKKTGNEIDMIAVLLNPTIRGWMNYLGKFNQFVSDEICTTVY